MNKNRILPKGWKEVVIGKEFKTGSGGTPLSTRKDYYEGGTIPWINSGELNKNYIDKANNYITELGLNNSSAKIFPKGTVLVAMYGATAGKTSLLNIDACTNQAICAILENPNYSNSFLKYNLENLYDYLVNRSTGSARDNLSQEGLADLSLFFPTEKKHQEDLIKVLQLIDNKIELNTRMNTELEAMAKQLYDYWFVQFDFPDENGNPYKSSGSKMVYNPTLKREIPEGWGVKSIEEIEDNIITGKTPPTSDEANFNGDIPFITIDDIRNNLYINQTNRTLSLKGADCQKNKYLPEDALCCSCIGTPGVLGFTAKVSQTNQQINSIIFQNDYNKDFLYFSLKMFFQRSTAKTGNILPNMNKEEFSNIIIIYPSLEILKEFKNLVSPLFIEIKNKCKEIYNLTNLRDSLLPMLMNGQVTVE